MQINFLLLIISLTIVSGYLAEWGFKRWRVPDTLFMLMLGILIGPNVLGYVRPDSLGSLAPVFTTFTLFFLIYEGSLKIDLLTFTETIGSALSIGLFNFLAASAVITMILYCFTADVTVSLMLGFALGGVSSAFVIPVITQMGMQEENRRVFSILMLESALTDVFSVVFAVTMIELIQTRVFHVQDIIAAIASLFSIAAVVGILGGFAWIYSIEGKLIEWDSNYMMTIAFLTLVYIFTEFLGGNGAISGLFFGMVLANAELLQGLIRSVSKRKLTPPKPPKSKLRSHVDPEGVKYVSATEKKFYKEISFFLKTFFFVYLGMLLDFSNTRAMILGGIISLAILAARMLTDHVPIKLDPQVFKKYRGLFHAIFARGVAPVAVILLAYSAGVIPDPMLVDAANFVIVATIVFSSLRLFIFRRFGK